MKKWRPTLSFSPFLDPLPPNPQEFFPYLQSENGILNRHLPSLHLSDPRSYIRSPFEKAVHTSGFFSRSYRLPKRKFSFTDPIKYSCFRCGGKGHLARRCKIPLRCYLCGGLGHKRFSCAKFRKSLLKSFDPEDTGKGWDGDYWILQTPQVLDLDTVDNMLLDPDVVNCLSPFDKGIVEKVSSLSSNSISTVCGDICKCSVEIYIESEDIPAIEECPYSPDPVNSEFHCQMQLNLNPILYEDFADFVIIDEFEDYYSDEEEFSDSSDFTSVDIAPAVEGDFHEVDREIFIYIEPWKFLMYCCIQSVDGFMRAARARARGSDELSPFKPATVNKKSVASKRNLGLDSPIIVRRSPRLNKGVL